MFVEFLHLHLTILSSSIRSKCTPKGYLNVLGDKFQKIEWGMQLTFRNPARKYTLILKDAIPPPDAATGGERSTLSYEYDFVADATELESQTPPSTKPPTSQDEKSSTAPHTPKIRIPFAAFAPTYRGRPQKDAARLNTYRIARWSFMCRSFFGEQEGPFSLKIRSVAAYRGERSALETLFQSRAAMPVVLLVATAVLGRSLVWAIDTFGR